MTSSDDRLPKKVFLDQPLENSSVDPAPGDFFPADRIPVYPDLLSFVRHPTVLYTDAYANDPIEFNVDDRFITPSATFQIETLPATITRDRSKFLKVNINDAADPELHSIPMYSALYNRRTVPVVFDGTFRELI